jgi:hypothetical protein
MTDKWTCGDLARAIKSTIPRIQAERACAEQERDVALWTLTRLLTNDPAPITDADMCQMEGWLALGEASCPS